MPPWAEELNELASTENTDPKEITTMILANIKSYSNPSTQITPPALNSVINAGELLPLRMQDEDNCDQYMNGPDAAMDILGDYVEITGTLLNHDVAWQEGEDAVRNQLLNSGSTVILL